MQPKLAKRANATKLTLQTPQPSQSTIYKTSELNNAIESSKPINPNESNDPKKHKQDDQSKDTNQINRIKPQIS